jgi:hypothetical protein
MTVVGANHQTIFARVAQYVRQIIGVLASHPHIIDSQRVRRKRPALAPVTVGEIVQHIRYLLRADLNEAPADLRKLFRNLFFEQCMKRADDGELELGKSSVLGEEVMMKEAAVRRMDANG